MTQQYDEQQSLKKLSFRVKDLSLIGKLHNSNNNCNLQYNNNKKIGNFIDKSKTINKYNKNHNNFKHYQNYQQSNQQLLILPNSSSQFYTHNQNKKNSLGVNTINQFKINNNNQSFQLNSKTQIINLIKKNKYGHNSNDTYLVPIKGPFPILPKKINHNKLINGNYDLINQDKNNIKHKHNHKHKHNNNQKPQPNLIEHNQKRTHYYQKLYRNINNNNNNNNKNINPQYNGDGPSQQVQNKLLQLIKNKSINISSSSNNKLFQPVTHQKNYNYSPQISRKQRSPISMHQILEQNSIGTIIKQSIKQQIKKQFQSNKILQPKYYIQNNNSNQNIFIKRSFVSPSIDKINNNHDQFKHFIGQTNIHPLILQTQKIKIDHKKQKLEFNNNNNNTNINDISQIDKSMKAQSQPTGINNNNNYYNIKQNNMQYSDPNYQPSLIKPLRLKHQNIQITPYVSQQFDSQFIQGSQSLIEIQSNDKKIYKGQILPIQSKLNLQKLEKNQNQIQQATQTPIFMEKQYQQSYKKHQNYQQIQKNINLQNSLRQLQKSKIYQRKKSLSPQLDGSRLQSFHSPLNHNKSVLSIKMSVRQDDDHRSIATIPGDNKKQFGFIYCRSSQFSDELTYNKITLSISSSISKIKQLLVQAQDKLQVTFRIPEVLMDPPSNYTNKKQLHTLMNEIFSYFNITPQIVSIKKYLNCIMFILKDKQYCILWYFSGKVYVGKWNFNGKYYYSTKDEQQKDEGFIYNKRQDFIQGVKQGLGFQWSPSKYVYFGQFKNNKKQGYGIMKKNSHQVYVGLWKDNNRDGWGKLYNEQGLILHNGQFKNGQIQLSKKDLYETKINDKQQYNNQKQ